MKILRRLHLGSNKISCLGAFAIAKALPKCNSLEKLTLVRNEIEDSGVLAIVTMLSKSYDHSLRELNLQYNYMTYEGHLGIRRAGVDTNLKLLFTPQEEGYRSRYP